LRVLNIYDGEFLQRSIGKLLVCHEVGRPLASRIIEPLERSERCHVPLVTRE